MDKNLCTVYIVRHGETQWNIERRLQGQSDSPLTEKGELQAKELGKQFENIDFDAIFSSDLLRAKRTAEIITLERKLEIITSELIRERAFGSFEGKKFEEIKEFDDAFNKLREEEKHTYKMHPEIESGEEISKRFTTFLREIGVRYAGKKVLIVTHGGLLRSFLIHIGFTTYKNLHWGAIANTAFIKLETDGVDFFVKETSGVTITSES